MFLDESISEEQSFETLQRHIAVESITSPSMFSLFGQILPKTSELIKSFIPNLTQFTDSSNKPVIKLDNKQRQEVLKAISRFSFTAYEDTLISVPEGFDGKLIPYLETLVAQGKVVIDHGKNVVAGYNRELAMFLSNFDVRTTLKSYSQHYAVIRKEREGYHKSIEAYFDKKASTLARQPLKTVIERFADLEKVFLLEEALLSIKKQQDFKAIISEVQRTADMLTLIKGRIDDGSIQDASGQAVKNLAEGSYEVAKYVEYIALYGYFVESALSSVNNTSLKLAEVFGVK